MLTQREREREREMTSREQEEEKQRKVLSSLATTRQWKYVLHECAKYPGFHKAKLTRSGDTALHLAVSDGQIKVVQQLIHLLRKSGEDQTKEALKVENEMGYTPLHLAAALGSVGMCECIASIDDTLIRARNHDNETPLFVAVLNGNKDAFFCLHRLIQKDTKDGGAENDYAYSYGRDDYGNTILHAAITREYFDLAFHIINLFGRLAECRNEQGVTPLHALARKPSAFKSGSDLGWFNKIIYNCTFVELDEAFAEEVEDEEVPRLPENYETCMNVFGLFRNLLFGRNKPTPAADIESQARRLLFPPNYYVCFEFVNLVSKTIRKAMLIILGCVSNEPRKVKREKEKHAWSLRTMNELIRHSTTYSYEDDGTTPRDDYMHAFFVLALECFSEASQDNQMEDDEIEIPSFPRYRGGTEEENHTSHLRKTETPLLIATKNGITEIVESILEHFPTAIHDMNSDGKNIFVVAIENRQPHLYQLLLEKIIMRNSFFRAVDNDGNTALHLAAKLGNRSWIIPGLKMQWEIKWYQFVKESMPLSFWAPYNKDGLTADEVFMNTHSDLVKDDIQWLMKTSDSCTIVTALIATVAFATSASVPGGVNGQNGEPVLRQERMFDVFSISSLFALCFSLIALITFLAILTTQHQAMDFRRKVPMLLLMGLTTLFISIASMVVSFCGGHFFILKGVLRDASVVEYLVALLPLIIFVTVQFPLYFNVLRATITKMPERHYMVTT